MDPTNLGGGSGRCQQISQTKAQPLRFRMGMTGGEPDQKPSLPSERGAGQVESTRRHKMSTVLKRPVRSSYWLVICKVTPEFQNSILSLGLIRMVCVLPFPDHRHTTQLPICSRRMLALGQRARLRSPLSRPQESQTNPARNRILLRIKQIRNTNPWLSPLTF